MIKHKILLADGTVLSSGAGDKGSAQIRSVTLTEQVNDQTDICPGAACAASAEIQLWAPSNTLRITEGQEFTLVRVDTLANTEMPVGIFHALQPAKASANVYKIEAYDRMTLLDQDISPWLREHQSSFPWAITDLVKAVCAQCGVTVAEGALDGLPNGDYKVQSFYADDITGRQILQWAGQVFCRFARMTPQGELTFAWYDPKPYIVLGPSSTLRLGAVQLGDTKMLGTKAAELYTVELPQVAYTAASLSYEDFTTAQVVKTQIRQSDTDVGVVYPPDEAGTNALVIQGNLLLTASSEAQLLPVAKTMQEMMAEISYTPVSVSVLATGNLPSPGDIITVTDAYGENLTVYITKRTISGQKCTLESTGNARRDGSAAINEAKYQNTAGKIFALQIGIDGLQATAADLEGKQAELQLTVDGLSSTVTAQYTELKEYADAAANTARDEAVEEAVKQAEDAFGITLEGYSTTVEMNSAIQQSASGITQEVNQTLIAYATKDDAQGYADSAEAAANAETDSKLTAYPTTITMESAIQQSADSITLEVSRTYATQDSLGDYTKTDEVRSKFALDPTSVTIDSGVITFNANSLVVNSTNFKLDAGGNVEIVGNFASENGDYRLQLWGGQYLMSHAGVTSVSMYTATNPEAPGIIQARDKNGRVSQVSPGEIKSGGTISAAGNATVGGQLVVNGKINPNGQTQVHDLVASGNISANGSVTAPGGLYTNGGSINMNGGYIQMNRGFIDMQWGNIHQATSIRLNSIYDCMNSNGSGNGQCRWVKVKINSIEYCVLTSS